MGVIVGEGFNGVVLVARTVIRRPEIAAVSPSRARDPSNALSAAMDPDAGCAGRRQRPRAFSSSPLNALRLSVCKRWRPQHVTGVTSEGMWHDL